MSLDELQLMSKRVERWLRDPRVCEAVADPNLKLDAKADFTDKANLQPVFNKLTELKCQPEWKEDEEHSAWIIAYHDATNAIRQIGIELAGQPEYRRMRALAKQIARLNVPPFTIKKESGEPAKQESWRELLGFLKSEGMKDANIQRYKGLGEMNAEQLWETTMNAETRTLLRVELKDMVESDEIFSTLMGENVEERRKFIEDNALDVRNLDV
jgi:DNA gyrase subunit B